MIRCEMCGKELPEEHATIKVAPLIQEFITEYSGENTQSSQAIKGRMKNGKEELYLEYICRFAGASLATAHGEGTPMCS